MPPKKNPDSQETEITDKEEVSELHLLKSNNLLL